MKTITTVILMLACLLSFGQQTPVYFPVNTLFGGAAYNQPITITAQNTLISDGQNIWAGTYQILPPSTNTFTNLLYPNIYLMTIPGVVRAARFTVPQTTNAQNVANLLTSGPLIYLGTNMLANLVPGTNVTFLTNSDGSITVSSTGGAGGTPLASSASVTVTNIGGTNYPSVNTNYDALGAAAAVQAGLGNAAYANTNTMKVAASTNADYAAVAGAVNGVLTNGISGNAATATTAAIAGNLQTISTNSINTNNASQLSSGTVPFSRLPSILVTNGESFVVFNGNGLTVTDADGSSFGITGGGISSHVSTLSAVPFIGEFDTNNNTLAVWDNLGNIIASNFTASAGGKFTGNGSGMTNLNASAFGSGTVPLAVLPDIIRPNIYYVQTNGNDATAVMGSINRPWLTFTSALAAAVSPAEIVLGVGTFYTGAGTNGSLLLANVSVIGQGRSLTKLTLGNLNLADQTNTLPIPAFGLIVNGDNARLESLTLGTNTGNGSYYAPLGLAAGTNFTARFVDIVGDSDCVYANGSSNPLLLNTNCSGEFNTCRFISGYDDVVLFGVNGGTNSFLNFKNCEFDVNYDANFGTGAIAQPNRGLYTSRITDNVQTCIFNITNALSLANYDIYVNSSNATNYLTLFGNYYTQPVNPVYVNGVHGVTTIHGAFDPANLTASGSVVIYDNVQFGGVTATNFNGNGGGVTNVAGAVVSYSGPVITTNPVTGQLVPTYNLANGTNVQTTSLVGNIPASQVTGSWTNNGVVCYYDAVGNFWRSNQVNTLTYETDTNGQVWINGLKALTNSSGGGSYTEYAVSSTNVVLVTPIPTSDTVVDSLTNNFTLAAADYVQIRFSVLAATNANFQVFSIYDDQTLIAPRNAASSGGVNYFLGNSGYSTGSATGNPYVNVLERIWLGSGTHKINIRFQAAVSTSAVTWLDRCLIIHPE